LPRRRRTSKGGAAAGLATPGLPGARGGPQCGAPAVRVDRRRAGSVEHLVTRLTALIERHPTFGYRRLWAILRFRDGQRITPKTVYRICALKRWFVHQRPVAPRPRVQGRISHAGRSNERWATDLTHVYCGRDGWAHLVAVIDCHDRELIGHEFALRGRAKAAERALEEACLERFGTLRPAGATPVVRSLPQPEGGMCLAAQLHQLRPRAA